MPYKDPEKRKEYIKQYYLKNKKKLTEQMKERWHGLTDEEKRDHTAKAKEWKQNNPERHKECQTIYSWKKQGLIHDDYSSLYEEYLKAENCEECGIQFGDPNKMDGRVMDHCHETGKFRNFLCRKCNILRG